MSLLSESAKSISLSLELVNFEICHYLLKARKCRPNFLFSTWYFLEQVAALRYNSQIFPLWSFSQSTSRGDLIDRVNRIVYNGVGTQTGAALVYAANNMFIESAGDRSGVPDLAVVLTDGRAQDKPGDTVQVRGYL